tara:strand:- start:203 stop:736 length:534 start_codon:yes stop_codon:yes gene_type:complete
MAGSLIKIDEVTISSEVSTVTIGGANWDTSYDVYKLQWNNLQVSADQKNVQLRILDSSNNPITTANYDVAQMVLRTDTTFEDSYGTGGTFGFVVDNYLGTATQEIGNGTNYLFNFNISDEFSFWTTETVYRNNTGVLRGSQGGGVLDTTGSHRGVQFIAQSGANLSGGVIRLYGLKK